MLLFLIEITIVISMRNIQSLVISVQILTGKTRHTNPRSRTTIIPFVIKLELGHIPPPQQIICRIDSRVDASSYTIILNFWSHWSIVTYPL